MFILIYQFLPFAAGVYGLCAFVAGYPAARTAVWRVGFALVAIFVSVAVLMMRSAMSGMVPIRDLLASFLSLYPIPMISTLGVVSVLEKQRLPTWAKLLVLVVVSAGGVTVGQYVAGTFFELVNASG